MTEREIIISFISSLIGGLVAGLIVWFVQQSYLNRREKLKEQKQKYIKAGNSEKIATSDIFTDFGLGTSIEHMKSTLGIPNKYRKTDFPVFSEEQIATHSYLYIFSNAYLKVTSEDNEVIDTITLFAIDESISLEGLLLPCDFNSNYLGKAEVTEELIQITNYKYIHTRFDSSFAFEYYTGGPIYEHYTFFGVTSAKGRSFENDDAESLVGAEINGICISSSDQAVFFIYENEIR